MPDWPSVEQGRDIVAEAERILLENEDLRESFAELQLAMEDRGWLALSINAAQQFTRDGLGRASNLCRILAVSNPLVKRGLALRHAYVWGQGVEVTAADEDVAEVIAAFNDSAAQSLTGTQAHEELERALGTDGNVFVALFTNPLTGRVQPRSIPFEEIAEVVCNPDDRDEPWFYRRRWSSFEIDQRGRRQSIQTEAFYPALGYRPRTRWKMLDDVEILWDAPMLHMSVNRLDGWDFGVGDAYAVMPWARAYAEFLTDWARLTKALSRYAWRISSDTKTKAAKAAQEVRRSNTAAIANRTPTNGSNAGETAVMAGSNLEAIPKSGATIDAESGKPLAGMVAAGLGVPVTQLLADPGQTGARAVAETLDEPTRLEMQGRRDLWAYALKRIYDYVIDQAIKAPRGPLQGTVVWDPIADREVIVLAGDEESDRTVTIDWPSLAKTDVKTLVDAIVAADGTEKVPPLTVARLLLVALGVEDIDDVLDELTDDDGNFIDPGASAGDDAARRFRNGEDPTEDL